ncbi:DUF1214 domain-containing protein [Hyphobacterium sp. HN65]|uniref:DUF1214 domain-containing protein n=1 Tax=Hyphobacterium lacteum TaxID=3116575 RepID=A0ABU7LPX1_9PROT|nr:DUF1214 domain-containing protein [Hyphobacterium sp. HN65]MEE2525968.1 DUF1214 domain-containing protein [Hyphobacterium sp. HN65]
MIRWLITLVLAVLTGFGSAVWLGGWTPLDPPGLFRSIEINDWTSDPAIGSETADPYTRAYVARRGLLGLRREEATYYIRAVDDGGAPLREDCAYVIEGEVPDVRWWSVTLYAGDYFLAQNGDDAHSIDASRATIGEDGRWRATIQDTDPQDGSVWISSRNAGNFDLLLRLYNASEAVLETPETALTVPDVIRLGCRGEGAS